MTLRRSTALVSFAALVAAFVFLAVVVYTIADSDPVRTLAVVDDTPTELVLTDGSTCVWQGGATGVFAGARLNYLCDDDAWLSGEPTRHDDRRWTITKQRFDTSRYLLGARPVGATTVVDIVEAVYAPR